MVKENSYDILRVEEPDVSDFDAIEQAYVSSRKVNREVNEEGSVIDTIVTTAEGAFELTSALLIDLPSLLM